MTSSGVAWRFEGAAARIPPPGQSSVDETDDLSIRPFGGIPASAPEYAAAAEDALADFGQLDDVALVVEG